LTPVSGFASAEDALSDADSHRCVSGLALDARFEDDSLALLLEPKFRLPLRLPELEVTNLVPAGLKAGPRLDA
jgi:hypothetical protein